jgi:hypothetical protein
LDAWHFRLGIYQALAGQQVEAIQIMNDLVSNPSVLFSNWSILAKQFVDIYQAPEDLYTACQGMPTCNLRSALQAMVTFSGAVDPSQAVAVLQQHGVSMRSSGVFDFDGDGSAERWITVQPAPMEKLEFWILAQLPRGVQAVFVQILDDNDPTPYYYEPQGEIPVVQFEPKQGFRMLRMLESQAVYLEFTTTEAARPTYLRDEINETAQALLDGTEPEEVMDRLLTIQADPRFRADCLAFYICGKLYTGIDINCWARPARSGCLPVPVARFHQPLYRHGAHEADLRPSPAYLYTLAHRDKNHHAYPRPECHSHADRDGDLHTH